MGFSPTHPRLFVLDYWNLSYLRSP